MAQSLAVGFDSALHNAPFAHAVLIDAALVVHGIEGAVEDGIEFEAVSCRDLRHSRRRHEFDIQSFVLEKSPVPRNQHRQIVNSIHERDLWFRDGLFPGH